jgi:PQQ-dependent catabolism-associated beta-propeller protein
VSCRTRSGIQRHEWVPGRTRDDTLSSLRLLRNLCGLCVLLLCAFSYSAEAKGTGKLFVSSEKDNAIAILDGAKDDILSSPVVCKRPRHMQLSPDRTQLLVACSDDHKVLVWDIAAGKVARSIEVSEDPEIFDLSPDGRTLYVSDEEDSALTAFDLATGKKEFQVKVGGEPEGVKTSPDGKRVYVTSEVASMVHVIDVPGQKILKNVPVGKRPRRLLLVGHDELWVTNELEGSVTILRTSDNTVTGKITFLPPGMRTEDVTPVGMALSPDGKTAFIGLGRANHVAAVDTATHQVKGYILVGRRAWGLATSRDGKRLYVANGLSDDMTIIDAATLKPLKTVKVGRVPHTVVVDD